MSERLPREESAHARTDLASRRDTPEGAPADVGETVAPDGAPGVLDNPMARAIAVAVLAVALLISAIPLANVFSSPETYSGIIASLDEKETTVLTLTASSAGLSAAVSAIPGDAGTPIAEKLVDLSADFMVVLAAIYLEKFLLTIFGLAAFRILFPAGCLLAIAAILLRRKLPASSGLARLAAKFALLGVVLVITVPASVLVSDNIEGIYQESIDQTVASAQGMAEEAQEAEAADAAQSEEGQEGEGGILEFFNGIGEAVSDIPDAVSTGLSDVASGAQNMINDFIESLAIMIVTSCVIPLLVLIFFLWMAKLILGVNIEAPMRALAPRTMRRRPRGRLVP